MDRAAPPTNAEIEAVVRAYLGRVARRYLPLLAGVVVLLLIVVLVPTATPRNDNTTGSAIGALGHEHGDAVGTTGTTTAPGVVAAGGSGGGTSVGTTTTGGTASGGASGVPAGPVTA